MFPVSVYLIPAGLARRGEGRTGRGQHHYRISIKMPGGQRLRTADIPPGSYPGNVVSSPLCFIRGGRDDAVYRPLR